MYQEGGNEQEGTFYSEQKTALLPCIVVKVVF